MLGGWQRVSPDKISLDLTQSVSKQVKCYITKQIKKYVWYYMANNVPNEIPIFKFKSSTKMQCLNSSCFFPSSSPAHNFFGFYCSKVLG